MKRRPLEAPFQVAASRKIVQYHRIPIESLPPGVFLKHLKRLLADERPLVFGFQMHESFETPTTGRWKSGIMPVPGKKHDKFKTGHAVMAVGYDDLKKTVLVRNSWGPDWGIGGTSTCPLN